ncbi:MAG: GntR family transcriptional regulator, partial [Victivallales bacterium]|nr:GntR family transcriptional regulator [Victivallales bacterium]
MHENTRRALKKIANLIDHGRFPANCFLPAERKLCGELGIGRGALPAIFRQLAATGYVRVESGRGVRVLPRAGTPGLRRMLMVENADFARCSSSEHLKILGGLVQAAGAIGAEASLLFFMPGTPTESLIERYTHGEFQAIALIEHMDLADTGRLLR